MLQDPEEVNAFLFSASAACMKFRTTKPAGARKATTANPHAVDKMVPIH